MWGKVSFHRSRKTVDESPSSGAHIYQSPSLSSSQTSELYAKALPTLPVDLSSGSQFAAHQPDPSARVASSIYSRDTAPFNHPHQRSNSGAYQFSQEPNLLNPGQGDSQGTRSVEISPPDSPITGIHSPNSSRVSSIEDEPEPPTGSSGNPPGERKFASHIPIISKGVDSQPDRVQTNSSAEVSTTRWNNEATTSNFGRMGQVTPGNVSFETHISAHPPPSHSSNIFGWGKDQLNSRKKLSETRNRFLKSDDPTFVPREPWRGQSGRSPMVNPIQEKPGARSSSRLYFSKDRSRQMNTPSPIPGIVAPSALTTIITAGEDTTPAKPPKSVRQKNKYDAPGAEAPVFDASVVSGPTPPRVDLPETELTVGLADLKLLGDDVEEPTSRLSVATYDPTEAASSTPSPRDSIDGASQISDSVSIMSRTRPVPSTIAHGKRPIRKPTPSEVSADKALPQCPPEMSAQSRIEMLEAKKNDLIRRRTNINTIIHELTQVIQPNSVAYDMAARDEVKKTVASLNNELAEIKREEHEVGLKLLRAWKKRDNEDFYGQETGLWVKRVTS
ncbi:hypothetical protein ARAM_005274 [Aspergillus rambellii]|uniref:BHLH domain-containing protein n=2 Tax=Aspergillus subgen. Nidulantes TaxID=2720870 RepID=A0A0F8UI85_9EURO|nr:hypothetical protein ARAM_005274 [Aspergillus rambellii]